MQGIFVMDDGAAQIIRMLEDAGFEAYAVGGCVRDVLLGRTPKDWDITTDALPEQVKNVFARTFDTGVKHGTISVRMFGKTYEVTTYRIDGTYADHRRPDRVCFTDKLSEDLSRRDFTINAMAYHPSRGVVDLFQGKNDLEKRIIRCVGRAEERFEEDALRMLRALRFSAYLSFDIEEETWKAIVKKRELMAFVSRERIAEELNKIMTSDEPNRIAYVWQTGLMKWCVPVFSGENFPYESLLKVPPERVLRWAMFWQRLTPEEVGDASRNLKFDNDTRDRLVRLAKYRERVLPEEPLAMRYFLSELGKEYFDELFAYRKALGTESEKAYSCYLSEKDKALSVKDLALSGRDLIALGYPQGPSLGVLLERLLHFVLEHPEQNEAELLKNKLSEISQE